MFRIIQGHDHFIWDYDQARDSFASKRVIQNKDIILVGQQAEIYGMFHGPLSYYYKSPFYAITNGKPWLVLYAMVLLNLTTIIPFGLLSYQLFKSRWLTLLSLLFFAISYDQVGYSRWISNVSMSIPFLAWTYYFLYMVIFRKKSWWWSSLLGISLGLAIQGQLFLLYLIPWCLLWFILFKKNWKIWISYFIGLFSMLLPQIIFEIKYGFQGSKIFYEWILLAKDRVALTGAEALSGYITHMSLTAYHAITGFSSGLGLFVLITCLGIVGWDLLKKTNRSWQSPTFILFLVVSHSVVFVFHYVDAVFQDLGIGLAVILLVTYALQLVWKSKQKNLVFLAIGCILLFQIALIAKNTKLQAPYSLYKFAQTGILLSQKLELVDEVYTLAQDKPFSFGVFGNPYGVRTLWATVFDVYLHRHPAKSKPDWYGYYALGYEGDDYFKPNDHPADIHILLIEPNLDLHSPYIKDAYFENIDEATTLIEEKEMYGYKIQLRLKKAAQPLLDTK